MQCEPQQIQVSIADLDSDDSAYKPFMNGITLRIQWRHVDKHQGTSVIGLTHGAGSKLMHGELEQHVYLALEHDDTSVLKANLTQQPPQFNKTI